MENSLMQQVRDTRPASATAVIWRAGQSGFLVKTRSALLCLDLYLSAHPMRVYPSVLQPQDIGGADILFGSHDHPDHIDRAAWPALLQASPNAVAVVPGMRKDDLCRALDLSPARVAGLEDGQTIQIGAVRLTGVASAHERLDRDPQTGQYPYMGVVIESEGVRIYQPGDTCLYEGLAGKLRALGPIDAMILPINGRDGARLRSGIVGNMTYQEAADLAGLLCPGLVIPAHYDMFQGNLEDPEKFVSYLTAKYPQQAFWVGEIGEPVAVTGKEQKS